MESIIQHHAILLKDKVRMEAYKRAVEAVVRPGDVVVDIGCGLGILTHLALKAGAAHVHAIEVEPTTFACAKLIAKHNGIEKNITFHKGLSTNIKLKEKADVIISEIFGNLGLNENLLPVIINARTNLLKKGGKIVPSSVKIFIAPVEHQDWLHTSQFLHNVYGMDCLPDLPSIDLGIPSVNIQQGELLAEALTIADTGDIHLISKIKCVSPESNFTVTRDGLLSGFAGWFETELAAGISFSTSPTDLTTHWKQAFLPLRTPEVVKSGQSIIFKIEITPDAKNLNSVVGYSFEISCKNA